jgi:hypothetical protein
MLPTSTPRRPRSVATGPVRAEDCTFTKLAHSTRVLDHPKTNLLAGVAATQVARVALAGRGRRGRRRATVARNSTGGGKEWQGENEGDGDASEHVC